MPLLVGDNMNWITLFFIIELGLNPLKGAVVEYENVTERYYTEMSAYVLMDAEVRIFDNFFIGGAIKTDIVMSKERLGFRPEISSYLFNAGIKFEGLEIGYRHLCVHPTMPYYINFNPIQTFDAGYDEFYIRISN